MLPDGSGMVMVTYATCGGTKSSDGRLGGGGLMRQVKLYAGSFTANEGFVWPEKKSACKFASFMFIFIPAI